MMIQKFKFLKLGIAISLLLGGAVWGLSAIPVYADTVTGNENCGVSLDLSGGNCKQSQIDAINNDSHLSAKEKKAKIDALNNPGNGLTGLISTVLNVLSVIAGVVAVIMIIVGGFKYVTSGGDANKIGSAKNTIIYALVGLIIAALAQVIARFVLGAVT